MIKLSSLLPKGIRESSDKIIDDAELPVEENPLAVSLIKKPAQLSYAKAASDGAGKQYQQERDKYDGESHFNRAKIGEER